MKITNVIKHPIYYLKLMKEKICSFLPDDKYLKIVFKNRMNRKLDLANPQTYNEKLQWLKLYDRNPLYTKLVDKYSVKDYVAELIGEQYVIPTYGVWDKFDDIDFDKLPDSFVLKTTHDSGGVVVCADKKSMNIKHVKSVIIKSLKRNYYKQWREWPYKNVTPKIIAEQYINDSGNRGDTKLTDYKFFCFNGNVDCVMLCIDRDINDTKFYFFDREWNLKRYNLRGIAAPDDFTLEKPKNLDEMFEMAEKMSKGIKFVRIDLYSCNDQIYFGEYTFFPAGGLDPNILPEIDRYWGNLIDIS